MDRTAVASSYDAAARKHSTHEALVPYRHFNNFIKKRLIDYALDAAADGLDGGRAKSKKVPLASITVLELCSGRGGDLPKYLLWGREKDLQQRDTQPRGVISRLDCVDISPASVAEAARRTVFFCTTMLTEGPAPPEIHHGVADVFHTSFWDDKLLPAEEEAAAATTPDSDPSPLPTGKSWSLLPAYSLISVQFALHYGCQSRSALQELLRRISDRLEEGGIFAGTIVDEEELRRLLREAADRPDSTSGAPSVRNRLFKIEAMDALPLDGALPVGFRYKFSLEDLVDCDEFAITRSALDEDCAAVGLVRVDLGPQEKISRYDDQGQTRSAGQTKPKLVHGWSNANNFASVATWKKDRVTIKKLGISVVLSENEEALVRLYRCFAFQKKTSAPA